MDRTIHTVMTRSNSLVLFLLVIFSFSSHAQFISGTDVSQFNGERPLSGPLACDTVFSFPTSYVWSGGLCDDGNFLYTISHDSCKLMKHTYTGAAVDSFLLPTTSYPTAGDITFDGNNLWIVIEQDSKVVKVDPNTGVVLKSFPINATTDIFGCAYDNGDLWITDYAQEMLYRVDTISGAILSSFNLGAWVLPLEVVNGRLFGIDFTQNTASSPMALIEIDKTNGTVISSTPWCLPYTLGLTKYTGDTWALSSGASFGLSRIYKFENTILSDGVGDSYYMSVNCHPNPTTGSITINIPDDLKVTKITVTDISGRVIKEINNSVQKSLDISDHPEGVYIVVVQSQEGILKQRITLSKQN